MANTGSTVPDLQQLEGVARLPEEFYTPYLSTLALNRKPSPIRGLFPLEKTPGLISLLAGKPNPATFPLTSLSFTTRNPADPSGDDLELSVDGGELAAGLQYSDTAGTRPLLEWLYGLQERFHGRTTEGQGWRISVGSGSQDLIFKAVEALLNPGDSVFVESPVYAGVIPMFENLGCEQIEVETDAHGISSVSLRATLEAWPEGKAKPKVLYTVPYGCNPTGMTATEERRKEVLDLAKEHGFLILEDDPYFYLYYGPSPRPTSYFSLEQTYLKETGRVVRFDSFSKVLSAGIRIGWVSGPVRIVGAIDAHTATSNLQSSSLTQALAATLLRAWGYDGFAAHVAQVSELYKRKRDVFERALSDEKEGMHGLAEWVKPEAGMFFWFKLLTPSRDSKSIIESRAFKHGVLALPGTAFLPNGRSSAYVRASFSLIGGSEGGEAEEEEEVREAVRRLRKAVEEAVREEGESHL